jgi:hypothetical protein
VTRKGDSPRPRAGFGLPVWKMRATRCQEKVCGGRTQPGRRASNSTTRLDVNLSFRSVSRNPGKNADDIGENLSTANLIIGGDGRRGERGSLQNRKIRFVNTRRRDRLVLSRFKEARQNLLAKCRRSEYCSPRCHFQLAQLPSQRTPLLGTNVPLPSSCRKLSH